MHIQQRSCVAVDTPLRMPPGTHRPSTETSWSTPTQVDFERWVQRSLVARPPRSASPSPATGRRSPTTARIGRLPGLGGDGRGAARRARARPRRSAWRPARAATPATCSSMTAGNWVERVNDPDPPNVIGSISCTSSSFCAAARRMPANVLTVRWQQLVGSESAGPAQRPLSVPRTRSVSPSRTALPPPSTTGGGVVESGVTILPGGGLLESVSCSERGSFCAAVTQADQARHVQREWLVGR